MPVGRGKLHNDQQLHKKKYSYKSEEYQNEGENPFGLHSRRKIRDQGEMEAEEFSKIHISKPGLANIAKQKI